MHKNNNGYSSVSTSFKKFIYSVPATIALGGMLMLTIAFFQVRVDDYTSSIIEYARLLSPQVSDIICDDSNSDPQQVPEQLVALFQQNFDHLNFISYIRLLDENKTIRATWVNDSFHYSIPDKVTVENDNYASVGHLFHLRHDFTTPNGETYSILIGLFTAATLGIVFRYFMPMYIAVFIGYFAIMFLATKRIQSMFITPIKTLTQTTAKIVQNSDLSIEVPFCGNNELGDLSNTFSQLINKLKTLLQTIKNISDQFNTISQKLRQAGLEINNNSNNIREQSKHTSEIMDDLNTSFAEVSKQLEELNKQSEHSASTVHEISMVNTEVANNINTMNDSVSNTINGINQITDSINFTTQSIEELHANVKDVSDAITRLNNTVNQEEKNAKDSLDIANQLAIDSANGMAAMEKTIDGIDKIKESSTDVFNRIQNLRQHIEDIDSIVHAIDAITKQTNLLALNAAIIAAQAGENGKSFGVVSEEIAALSNRTKQSTKEITELIETIQEETVSAAKAMEAGQQIIEEGTQVGNQAKTAFGTLKQSANNSASKAQEMAQATFEQNKEIKLVTTAINNIANAINSVNETAHIQANEAKVLDSSAKKMALLNKKVADSSEEQGRSSQNVLEAISVITEMTQKAITHQHDQTTQTKKATEAFSIINRSTLLQQNSATQLFNVIENINYQLEQLTYYIDEFKV